MKTASAEVNRNNGDALAYPTREMVWIEGREFRMGSDDHYPEEAPAHPVRGQWLLYRSLSRDQSSVRRVCRCHWLSQSSRACTKSGSLPACATAYAETRLTGIPQDARAGGFAQYLELMGMEAMRLLALSGRRGHLGLPRGWIIPSYRSHLPRRSAPPAPGGVWQQQPSS